MKQINKGFTMIELLIVIAIIGILSTTLVPKLVKEIRKATVAKVQHNLGVIRSKLSLDQTLLEVFPDLAGEDNSDLLELYRIEATPGFTNKDGDSYKEISEVVSSRTNVGGWYYIRETGNIYANLPNGAYTKDEEYEIWNGEDSNSVSYDFTDIDVFDADQAIGIDGWEKKYNQIAIVENPYSEYSITTTGTFKDGSGYGVIIQSDGTSNTLFQFDEEKERLTIVTYENYFNKTSEIYLDTTSINTSGNWWTTEHTVTINVTDSENNDDTQNVEILIDDVVISDSHDSTSINLLNFTSDPITITKTDTNNSTGIKVWGNNNITDIDSVSITEL